MCKLRTQKIYVEHDQTLAVVRHELDESWLKTPNVHDGRNAVLINTDEIMKYFSSGAEVVN